MRTLNPFRSQSWLFVLLAILISTCAEPEKPRPNIETIDPSQGAIGQEVAITGKNFSAATSVKFGSITAGIVSKTKTEIITVVPAGVEPGIMDVTVKAESASSNKKSFTVLESVPVINAITPDRASSGMTVVLKGEHFNTVSKVTFAATAVTSFTSASQTEVTLIVPETLALGATNVTITTEGGTSEPATFTVIGKPTLTQIAPAIGPVDKVVVLTGTNLLETSKVFFGSGEATVFTVKSATSLEAKVPATATTGKVKVITPGGEALSAVDFVVKGAPQITNFAPANGVIGTDVTINGLNFQAAPVVVKFGTVSATTVTVNSDSKITAKVPAGATTNKITVETASGSVQSAADFTVNGVPTITSFTPTSGVIGAEITITGTNFVSVSEVKFNTTVVAAANYTVVSATQIKAKVPTGAATGKISVKNPAGTGTSATNFTVAGSPTVTSFTPTSGEVGKEITITGTNFTGATAVKFNATAATTMNVVSATSIKANVPAGATKGKISVTNAVGTGTSADDFTVLVAPVVTSFTPAFGPPETSVEITGTGFTGATAVKFNNTTATFTLNSDTKITAKVPAGATTGKINVTNPAGNDDSPTDFSIEPFITTLNPVTAATGATVTITGTNLSSATVKFGGFTATKSNNTSTSITVTVPAGLNGAVNVTAQNAGGTSNAKTFTVTSTVVVTEIVATKNIKNQLLLFRGTGLLGATKVHFGTTEVVPETVTATVVTAYIPVLTPNTYAVKVTTPNGTSNSKNFELASAQNTNTGGAALADVATVTPPPDGYVPPVANQWENEIRPAEKFFLYNDNPGAKTFSITFTDNDAAQTQYEGTGFYDKAETDGVLNNYIEFTVNGVRYCGLWTKETKGTECFHHMVLISSQSGGLLTLKVGNFSSCP